MALPARSVQDGVLKVKNSYELKLLESTAKSQRQVHGLRGAANFALEVVKWQLTHSC